MWKIDARDKPFLFALVAITFLLCAIVFDSHPPSQPQPQQQQACEECADKNQAKVPTLFGLGANEYIAMFTAGTLGVLLFQAWAAFRANTHFRVTERAYVKLSHFPPGVRMSNGPRPGYIHLLLRTKNFGKTPAKTTGFSLAGRVFSSFDELPIEPPYHPTVAMGSFLVAEDETSTIVPLTIDEEDFADVMIGKKQLLIFGYVEYADQFGDKHRAGYARVFDPSRDRKPPNLTDAEFADRNNLLFFDSPSTYNFDLPISQPFWKRPWGKPWTDA